MPATLELADSEIESRARFARLLDAEVPDAWPPEILADALPHFRKLLREDPERSGWLAWYALLETGGKSILVASVGFTGPPDADGRVEIGYSVIPAYQGQGIATEMVLALVAWAFRRPEVVAVEAETTETNRRSVRVLEKAGFARLGSAPSGIAAPIRFRRPCVPVPPR